MDLIDRKILEELKRNGRASASAISRRVHLSAPAVAERIHKLERVGVIHSYTVRLDQYQLGYRLTAFVLVSLDHARYAEGFRVAIVQHPCVLECHHIAGPNDYLLKVLCRDTLELEHFLSDELKKMEGVAATNTLFCLSTLKEESNR